MFSHSQMQVLILAAPAEPDDILADSVVQLSHNLLKNIISGPVDGPKRTPNKFDDKRTYIWCERASRNKFRPTAFSRSVQTPLVRPGFDAVVCVQCIKAHTMTTVSHCHEWRS